MKCPHCHKDLPDDSLFTRVFGPGPFEYIPPVKPDRGTPHKCPRCDGTGSLMRVTSSSYACTTCLGTGILWSRGL